MEAFELGGRLMTLNVLRRNAVQAAAPDNLLHHSQLPVLEMIIRYPDGNQAMLAEQLHVTPASIALSTKRLEKAGLIERRVDPDNRRCNQLRATELGCRMARAHRETFEAVDERTFSCLSEEERIVLKELLGRMIHHMAGGEDISLFPYCKEEPHSC